MKANHKIIVSITGTILLTALIALVVTSFWAFRQNQSSGEARRHTYALIMTANALMSELKDAETGQRGYSLTGDERYLEPYLKVRDNITEHLNQLRLLTLDISADTHLDAMVPLIEAKLEDLAHAIVLRRNHVFAAEQLAVGINEDKRLMDAIRTEMSSYIEIEEAELTKNEAKFQANMQKLFVIISSASLLTLLLTLLLAYLVYLQTRQQLKNVVHLETKRLLELQERINLTLQVSEEKLAVTLDSIGDAVIATDAQACITLMNPVAELLTGWSQIEASGRPINEIFNIFSKETRQPATIPILETLAHGTIQGLANHTVLVARDGSECDIADSCAPIIDRDSQVIGAVLVFRNVTAEYAAQLALHDSTALIQTILNTVGEGIVTLQARGGIVETVNPAAEQMFGYNAAELIGQHFSLLIPELDHDKQDGSLEYYSVSEESRAIGLGREVVGRRKNGSFFPMEIAVSEMYLGGQRYFTGILRDISARKQAEEALFKAGALQKGITDSAMFSKIATDTKGVIQLFNVGAECMLGYAATDVINKISPADISDPQEIIDRAQLLSDELGTPIKPGFEALVFKASRGIEDIYELTYIRKNGTRFPAIVSVTALRDPQNEIIGYLLIGTDNTARKQAEEERQQFFNISQELQCIAGFDGYFKNLNSAWEKTLGFTKSELFAKPFIEAIHPDDRQATLDATEILRVDGALISLENRFFCKDGSYRWFLWTGSSVIRDQLIFGSALDITERKQDEEVMKNINIELRLGKTEAEHAKTEAEHAKTEAEHAKTEAEHAKTEAEHAKTEAENANLAKSDFLSRMSHELRTPLNAILGFAQLLEAGSPPPTSAQTVRLDEILKAGWYLLGLINEVLDLALIESGKLSMSSEPLSLNIVLIECQAMLEQQAQQHDIKLTIVPFDNTWFVYADRTRVKQILINLLSNAIKYNREHGSIEVICTSSTPERIRVSIKDSGYGLTPEKLAQLFQPFNRLGQENGLEEGTGIGLVVTKQLVELMGGSIGVDSTVGIGSEFWIELIKDNNPHLAPSKTIPNELAPQAEKSKSLRTLLYVEDNPANLLLVEQIIESRPDIRMLSARDGNLGIALAREHLPNVILMDINLPGISGTKALKILCADPRTTDIPVIALSANAMPNDIEKGLEAGFFRYLTKPIKINEFMIALDEALKFSELELAETIIDELP